MRRKKRQEEQAPPTPQIETKSELPFESKHKLSDEQIQEGLLRAQKEQDMLAGGWSKAGYKIVEQFGVKTYQPR